MQGGMGGRPDDDWGNRRGGPMGGGNYGQDPRMGGPGRGPMPGREGSRALDRRGSQQVDDKWERRGPPPPSPGHGRMGGRNDSMSMSRAQSGAMQLHRTERRFVAGQSQSEDPEEEKRQKAFQGVLNKITPDNFERLTRKILEEIGITEQRTLEGLIDKIFDKALTDLHFCELYASMCKELSMHPKCPKFENPEPGGKPIDLRRLILYKCQEEFEKGSKAMEDVAAREAAEASSPDKPAAEGGEAAAAKEEGAGSGGGAAAAPAAAAPAPVAEAAPEDPKVAERRKADADRAARRRMLGNIQFISYLYKNGLLTERIMHSCVVTLLKEQDNPRPEDVECLCKLLTVVGAQLDATTKPENQKAMKAYFDRLDRMQKDTKKLESRIRFMIQDVLELRASRWIPRTKKEGPKKIEDVHREAQQELLAQQQRDMDERRRGGGDRRGGGGDRGGYGGPPPPRPGPSYADTRLLSKDEVPSRAIQMQRAQSNELSFRPGGSGFGRPGANARNASPSGPAAAAASAAAAAMSGRQAAQAGAGGPAPPSQGGTGKQQAAPAQQPAQPAVLSSGSGAAAARAQPTLSLDQMKVSVESLVKEFFTVTNRSVSAAVESLWLLRERGADMAELLPLVISTALEQRGIPLHERIDPMADVFEAAISGPPPEGATGPALLPAELEAGAGALARDLHSLAEDQPKAPKLMGPLLAGFVAKGWLSIKAVLGEVLAVPPMEDGPDPPLVEVGGASDLLIGLMSKLKELQGEEAAAAAWKESGLDGSLFFDEITRESPDDITQQFDKAGLAFLSSSTA